MTKEREKKEVLVVDDDPHHLYTLKRIFKDESFELITAESGEECLKKMDEGFEGVILMDIMMPEMDGWGTIREIVENYDMENIVIVMLTAKDSPEENRADLQKYVVDYVRKPFTGEDLKRTIKKYQKFLEV